jgi:hypothetical protein
MMAAVILVELTVVYVQVIHSELDYRLPMSEGLAMFNVLQARGVPSKLLVFPDENHVSDDLLRLSWTRLTLTAVGAEAGELAGVAPRGTGLDQ